jgi:hypothetical protein
MEIVTWLMQHQGVARYGIVLDPQKSKLKKWHYLKLKQAMEA